MADLVLRGDGQGFAELTGFDRARAFQEAANRTGQSGADDDRKDEAERSGKRGENDGDHHDCPLLADRRRRVGLQKVDHLRSDRVELLVKLVA